MGAVTTNTSQDNVPDHHGGAREGTRGRLGEKLIGGDETASGGPNQGTVVGMFDNVVARTDRR